MSEKSYHHGDLKNTLIQVGIKMLAEEGIEGFSLRKVAREAGVTHSAPYAHFADKQAMIAAISTDGYRKVYERINAVVEQFPNEPLRQFIETAWAYVSFGFDEPDHFKITFSGSVEREREYPALVEMTSKTFDTLRQLIIRCQKADLIDNGEPDLAAVTVWGFVHGFVHLIQESMVSHVVTNRYTKREMLILSLNHLLKTPLTKDPQDGSFLGSGIQITQE
jgi:AcrR family transcriptional regulator